jgi:hypothetical protein
VTQTHTWAQNASSAQKLTAHAVASPSQSASPRHGISEGMTMVVVVVIVVLDVLAVVVEDVVDGPTSRTCVVVVGAAQRRASRWWSSW